MPLPQDAHPGSDLLGDAVDDGRIRVDGPPKLARELPMWNHRSKAARMAKAGAAG